MEHETGKILHVDRCFSLRNEYNGMTIYDRIEHIFRFYENLFIEDIAEEISRTGADAVHRIIAKNAHLMTKNVQSDNPFFVGWMISGHCNLDCIYCFAQNKAYENGSEEFAVTPHELSPCRKSGCDEYSTADHLLNLKPLCIGLTGGEPTLNPKLKDILVYFKGKVSTILDTNGTTPQLIGLIPILKDSNTTVRLTVDILDNEILNVIRPEYGSSTTADSVKGAVNESSGSQAAVLANNIKALLDAGVPLVIHSVLTKYNIGRLENTAETLIRLGVKRWHFYPVNYSEKCKDIFEDIKVSRQEACDYTDTLAERFGKEIKITCPRNDIGFREKSVLLIDCYGRFFVDTIHHGSVFLGEDPTRPRKDEILAELDFELHQQGYLSNYW